MSEKMACLFYINGIVGEYPSLGMSTESLELILILIWSSSHRPL